MNATQAANQSQILTNDLFNSSKEMATRLNITVEEAINKKVSVFVKYAQSASEAIAWEIRGENAKKLLFA